MVDKVSAIYWLWNSYPPHHITHPSPIQNAVTTFVFHYWTWPIKHAIRGRKKKKKKVILIIQKSNRSYIQDLKTIKQTCTGTSSDLWGGGIDALYSHSNRSETLYWEVPRTMRTTHKKPVLFYPDPNLLLDDTWTN